MNVLQHERLVVTSDLATLNAVQGWFNDCCTFNAYKIPWLENQIYPLNLALAEGFSNAVRHAHRDLPAETVVEIDLAFWDDWLELRVWDQGPPFDPDILKEPEPGTLRKGGYGWFLLRRLADRVSYDRYLDGRNCLLIVKYGFQR